MLNKTSTENRKTSGFSLIEMAIVLVILAVFFTYIVVPQGEREDQIKKQITIKKLENIKGHLVDFFYANGFFPCPASTNSKGIELRENNNNCVSNHGFVPITTLEIQQERNEDSLMVDAWQKAIRYSISNVDINGNGLWDWVNINEFVSSTPTNIIKGNLVVCSQTDCQNSKLTESAILIVFSLGKINHKSSLEQENLGTTVSNNNQKQYAMPNNNKFISLDYEQEGLNAFDDLLYWVSPLETYKFFIIQ